MYILPNKRNFAVFMNRDYRLLSILFVFVFSSCATKYSKVLKSTNNEYKLKMADEYYKEKRYAHSQELYQGLMTSYLRGKPEAEEAYYRYAYCAFYLKDYEAAGLAFQTFTDNFPNSDKVPEMAYMEGYCLFKNSPKVELDQTSTQKAISTLQVFLNTYPNDPHAAEAKNLIEECNKKLEEKEYLAAQLYYDLGYFKSAHIYFDLLMSDYPNSERSEEYMYKTVLSSFKYASNSIEYLQIDRYQTAVDECDNFSAQYPKSKFLPKVEVLRKSAQNELTKLNIIKTKLQNEQIKKAS